jgi:uncharacterized Zn finger protein
VSWWPPTEPRRPGSGPWRAAGKRPFGTTWWGGAWVEALEQRARFDANRLPRGRTYARTGAVDALTVLEGEIVADVQGSRADPYEVSIEVRQFSKAEWRLTLDTLASQLGHLAALLDGEMPPGVAADLAAIGIELLPIAGDLEPWCSCPDWAVPCKHAAAVCYLVADALDEDPFLLFLMRGRKRDDLLTALRARRASRARGAEAISSPAADWPEDDGIVATQAWSNWDDMTAAGGIQVPSIPLPPARPGRPTILGLDPPPDSGVTLEALHSLASEAVERAWAVAHGDALTGLDLSPEAHLARRSAGRNGEFKPSS